MRKQFKDPDRVSSPIRVPQRTDDRRAQPSLLQRRYRLLRAQDRCGQQILYVYDRALGRSLLCWRGALASALLETAHLRTRLGTSTTAPCDKATVRQLMLDAARYAATTRADAGGAGASDDPRRFIAAPAAQKSPAGQASRVETRGG